MIIHILIGIAMAAGMAMILAHARSKRFVVKWWQWVLTVLGLIYSGFVLEVIAGFLIEGAAQAALVNGLLTGIVAIVWGVLLARFVYSPRK